MAFLSINAETIIDTSAMKYATMDEFQAKYGFSAHCDVELHKLFQIANWMNIFFRFVPAKKNKGLCMQVVPKLVEGKVSYSIMLPPNTPF